LIDYCSVARDRLYGIAVNGNPWMFGADVTPDRVDVVGWTEAMV
jgi:hypothetical protein